MAALSSRRVATFAPGAAEYAQVLRMLGNGRLEAHCMDGVKRLCHIRGKMRKKVRRRLQVPPCLSSS